MAKIKGAVITIQILFKEGYEQPATLSAVESLRPAIDAVCEQLKSAMEDAFDETPLSISRCAESNIVGGIIIDPGENVETKHQRNAQYN